MAQPVKTKPTIEKPLTCAWWVWRAEKDYEGLTEILGRAMYAESTEERERLSDFAKKQLGLLRDSYLRVETHCGLDLSESEDFLKDAEEQISGGRWMDAKWSLLFSSAYLLDELKRGVKAEGGEL
jgi:hypothetical protein